LITGKVLEACQPNRFRLWRQLEEFWQKFPQISDIKDIFVSMVNEVASYFITMYVSHFNAMPVTFNFGGIDETDLGN
jgi:hypothetical protein